MSRGARKPVDPELERRASSAFAVPNYRPKRTAKPLTPAPAQLELTGDDWQDIMGALQCGIKAAQAEGDTRKVDRLVRLLMTASNALVNATRK